MADLISRRKEGRYSCRDRMLDSVKILCQKNYIQHLFPKVALPVFPRREPSCAAGSVIKAPSYY